jgi:TolA-binding protein
VNKATRLQIGNFKSRRPVAFSALAVLLFTFAFILPPSADALGSKKKKKKATLTSSVAAKPGGAQSLNITREKIAIPKSQAAQPPSTRSLKTVKPPKSSEFYDGTSKEAEYENLVDQEIAALFKLSRQSAGSANRGEIWLRLGERYAEKAQLVEFHEQADYDKKVKAFLERKSRAKPKLDLRLSHEYSQKAVQLYEWFVRDFPRDSKVDQALFFLGYNHFELAHPAVGEKYYVELLQRFPESTYVTESRFALGEYYFDQENWQKALDNYLKVIAAKRARLNAFALYKSAWCYYRLGRAGEGLKFLERVIRISRANENSETVAGRKAVNKVRLMSEALRDYVPFFAEAGHPKDASSEFRRLSGSDTEAVTMLERLGYLYADAGSRANASYIFKQLIGLNPTGERAAEYQHQTVLMYLTSDPKLFRRELELWLDAFGPDSEWAKINAKNPRLVAEVARLQETTLRNHVLQLHQTAQNSRVEYAQAQAATGYSLYNKYFPNSPQIVEMQFFHAELLFDMGKFEEAAVIYTWVAEKDPKGPYREKCEVNILLALERDLPTPADIEAKRGKSIERIPFDPSVVRFEKGARRYLELYPHGERSSDIRRRLGVLYYSYNHFDDASVVFEKIIRDDPKSQNAEIAGNLLFDIYKLRNDMVGMTDKGRELLAIPGVANTKFGAQIRAIIERSSYLKADKLAESGEPLKAAKEFELFANSSKQTDLATAARYKAALNYEKAGDLANASRMHSLVLLADPSDPKVRAAQIDSRNALARIFQQTGQLDKAAKQFQEYAQLNPKDQKAVNGYFNAGVLLEALGDHTSALRAYDNYLARSSNPDRIEVPFIQAEIWRKQGKMFKAAQLYEQYTRQRGRNQSHAVQAAFWIGEIARLKHSEKQEKIWFNYAIDTYRSAARGSKTDDVTAAAKFAAEARFDLARESTLVQLLAIRFTAKDKQQAQAAGQVKILREKFLNDMKDVVRFDNATFIVAALTASGQMFDSISNMFARIPTPSGFNPEEGKKYRELIQTQINGFKNDARASYKAAVDRSRELESYSEWTKVAQAGLLALDGKDVSAAEFTNDVRVMDGMGL